MAQTKDAALTDAVIDKIEEMKRKHAELNEPVRGAIIGVSGTGKSTLINAIVGRKVAKVGSVETTMEAQEVTIPIGEGKLILADLPGCSTVKFPLETYLSKFDIDKKYDFCIVVFAVRIFEQEVELIKALKTLKKPYFLVRTRFDEAILTGDENGESRDEVVASIKSYVTKQFGPGQGVYLVAGRQPNKYDHEKLMDDIAKSLGGMKAHRFRTSAKAWTEKAVKAKRASAEEIVSIYAALAAANGLNPIPGLDISLDLGLLIKMGREVTETYGLDDESIEQSGRVGKADNARIAAIKQKVAQVVGRYVAREGVLKLLARFAGQTAAKSFSRWVPFVGPLISAGIGYKMTLSYGEDLIDSCESASLEAVGELIDSADLGEKRAA